MKALLTLLLALLFAVGGLTTPGWARLRHHLVHHSHRIVHPHHSQRSASLIHRNSSLACLTSAVYHEARGEPQANQLAVARVVLDRTLADGFKPSVCGVIAQVSYRYAHHRGAVPQFPWYYNKRQSKINDLDAYHQSMLIAKQAMDLHRTEGTSSVLYFASNRRCFDRHKYKLTRHQGHLWFFESRSRFKISKTA